ncbi:3-oxoacyl-ACP synthase [Candidatus Omnitrophus magneticus]|uniref:Beta-ketoacyl-[acyl-carrier-protein] synthase III n=1 Tax=Candidatus Omnitrophus magneticus TaxID=1609969 RepID=A0A0F0CV77_9BACT|nr:3-oxoacyl-ACP synthase [Candidatus Omnitrophus magneticus]
MNNIEKTFRTGILGVGKYLPERRLTNADLEKMIDTTDEWIVTRTGIKERRIARDDEAASDMAVKAAQVALKNAGLEAKDIELIIVATITPDMFFPSTACQLQYKLGITGVPAFDISVACSGYVYGLAIADQFIKSGLYKYALVVASEKLSTVTDWDDRSTCVLFGDGSGAAVLGRVDDGGIMAVSLGADGSKGNLLQLPAGGSRMPASKKTVEDKQHTIKMEGNVLFKHAVKIMAEAALDVTAKLGLKGEDIDIIIPHQANIRILNALAQRMGVDPDKKVYLNIYKYGNMSAASSAVALTEAVEEGRIKKGDTILMDAFGGGLTWGALVIKW